MPSAPWSKMGLRNFVRLEADGLQKASLNGGLSAMKWATSGRLGWGLRRSPASSWSLSALRRSTEPCKHKPLPTFLLSKRNRPRSKRIDTELGPQAGPVAGVARTGNPGLLKGVAVAGRATVSRARFRVGVGGVGVGGVGVGGVGVGGVGVERVAVGLQRVAVGDGGRSSRCRRRSSSSSK
eukprot:5020961-Pyramimonas_sp.AAC.1